MKIQQSAFIEFKHTGGPFVDTSFQPSFDILPPKAKGTPFLSFLFLPFSFLLVFFPLSSNFSYFFV